MFKTILSIFMLTATLTANSQMLSQSEAVASVKEQCKEGCVILSKEQTEEFNKYLAVLIAKAQQQAYVAGQQSCGKQI